MTSQPAGLGSVPVAAVLFDYGHTLVSFCRPDAQLAAAYREIAELVPEADSSEHLLHVVHDRIDAAVTGNAREGTLEEIDHVGLAHQALTDAGYTVARDVADAVVEREQRAWWHGIVVAPEAANVLSELRALGLRLGLCSNAAYRPASMHAQLRFLDLERHFDSITLSSEAGWRKPSSHIFTTALAALGAAPATTVMVGDRCREDIEGAHLSGMRAIRLRQLHDDQRPVEAADLVVDHLADLPKTLQPLVNS